MWFSNRTGSNRTAWWLAGLLAVVFLAPRSHAQSSSLPVFPRAQGFGTQTRAAYGGSVLPTVHRVTNLNDSGAGSLRAALTASVPRVVIFEVSGYISLSSPIAITSPYLTVAGQTAPSPGITVRYDYLYVAAHDVLIQHLRIRPSDQGGTTPLVNRSGISVEQGSYNVVIDHNSISWHTDEGISAWTSTTHDVTFNNNIVSEGLSGAFGSGKGGVIGPAGLSRVSILRNLYAHNPERSPYLTQGTSSAIVNNIMYNWTSGAGATFFIGSPDNGALSPIYSAVVGNRYIRGPNTGSAAAIGISFYGDWLSGAPGGLISSVSELYKSDNTVSGTGMTEYVSYASFDPLVGSPPTQLNGILNTLTVLAGSATEAYVLAHAGARPADRDSHDARIVAEVANRTGSIKGLSAVGAWPTLAVNARPLTLPANPNALKSSGYTNLEVWLHDFSALVEGTNAPAQPTNVRIVQN